MGFLSSSDDTKSTRGVVATNQHIYFVDDRLSVIGQIKWHQSDDILSLQWLGAHTALVSTRNHLYHVYGEKHPRADVVLSMTQCLERST